MLEETAALLLGAQLVTVPAVADDGVGYTVDDVVSHFSKAPELGKTRRLCIGTPSECGAEPKPVVEAPPINKRDQFEFGSSQLTPEARNQLDIFAKAATGDTLSSASFRIDGHTDAHGGEQANLSLSESRAGAVVEYLVGQGVEPSRLIASGFGESRPANNDPYDGGNRRVEASLAE